VLLASVTKFQPADGELRVAVQRVNPPPESVVAKHVTEIGGGGPAASVIVAVAAAPPKAAVTTADCAVENEPVETPNVDEVAALPIVTLAGTVSVGLELEIVTVAPPAGAALLSVTVHRLAAFAPRLDGVQESADTATPAARLRVAVALVLLKFAVTVADWSLAIVLVVSENVAEFAPWGTVTVAGTRRAALRLVRSATTTPPVGATLLNVTVQVPELFEPRLNGKQLKEETDAPPMRFTSALAELPL
jgi:hypothetical protein